MRVAEENFLGEPGDEFRTAMNTLNSGRMSMGISIAGGMKRFLDLTLEYGGDRQQFGRPLLVFEFVEEKGLDDDEHVLPRGHVTSHYRPRRSGARRFFSRASMTKIASSGTGWYALNKAFQVHGGTAYMNDHPLARALRDFRIFPIFEGTNDVMRALVALNRLEALSEDLPDVRSLSIQDPAKAIGVLAPYVSGRIHRAIRPGRMPGAHPTLVKQNAAVVEQTVRLRDASESALRRHGKKV